jgi:hypothetical protein
LPPPPFSFWGYCFSPGSAPLGDASGLGLSAGPDLTGTGEGRSEEEARTRIDSAIDENKARLTAGISLNDERFLSLAHRTAKAVKNESFAIVGSGGIYTLEMNYHKASPAVSDFS